MIRRLIRFYRKLWPEWVTAPLNLKPGQAEVWWHGEHPATVEVLWKSVEMVTVERRGLMLR